MSHRRILSQGNVPFSWEEKPGIPKSSHHQKSSSDTCIKVLYSDDPTVMITSVPPKRKNNIAPPPPPPPCTTRSKSFSKRWFKLDDPFLTALKSCSKSVSIDHQSRREDSYYRGKNYGKSTMSSVFSCKHSCDIVENGHDNLLKFSKLPPIPKERYSAKSFVKNSHN